ncbi:sensor histidine kinase [Agrococcus sp. SGAir0287]|uniref:sensor histidine kinase n=1 Tax=Agrococcus sp. SGAir0287 TaxID=2070347 RepID=UPI0010CCB316|nr:HAMP domain-containing sensor histidine kinase [Agrococcus sp. SGAir0287]QCR18637.1 two-component sensor histidine kinase [Agrococcus sp. SGAir0287]
MPTRRREGASVRVRLALSYAAVVVGTGALLLAVVAVFLLRYVPAGPIDAASGFVPNRGDLVRAFTPAAALAMGVLLVVGVVGGWLLAGRMLAPLDRIGEAARLATQGSLQHRIRLPGRRDELRDLADAFDGMLDRLEAHVSEQERFAANASHELRTPLATMQAMLDVARATPEEDVPALLERLHAVNARAIDLTESLLLLARADGRAFARERVDLSLAAEDAVETLLPRAEARSIAVDAATAPAVVVGSPTLLRQLAANLVENAIVHNLDADGRIHVGTGERDGVAWLAVESTGERIDPADAETLAEPFRRGSTRVHDRGGVGLGLAIVRSIVAAHDGALVLRARPDGGLRVTIELPRVAR